MPEVFHLNRPLSESSGLKAIVSGNPSSGSVIKTGKSVLSNASVSKLASSSASFKSLAVPSLPINTPRQLSAQIFDQPAKEFEDITAQLHSKLLNQTQTEILPPQPSLPPPPPPKDPFLERLHNTYLLSEYLEHFPTELASLELDKEEFKSKTDEELKSLIRQVRIILSSTQTGSFIRSTIDKGVGIFEGLALENGFEVDGLANHLKKDEEWKKLCKEAELAYCDHMSLSIEQRIVFKVVQTGAFLHETTRIKKVYGLPDNELVREELVQLYGDLIE